MMRLSVLALVGATQSSLAFVPFPTGRAPASSTGLSSSAVENNALEADAKVASSADNDYAAYEKYWEVAPTQLHSSRPLPPDILAALHANAHPEESQSDLGRGVFVTSDWRRAWHTYESSPEEPDLIDPRTGLAEYEITEIDGVLPDDLVGTMYRNGPGKFGVEGERVQHVLDSDGLVLSVTIDPPELTPNGKKRKVTFRSRFVETEGFLKELEAGQFLYRGTFGTAARAPFDDPPRKGVNNDPSEVPLLSKIAANALKTNIKNSANTQVIAFGGKLLALFEAGLPYRLDPVTLETLGEDDMQGTLGASSRLPVKLAADLPEEFLPSFLGGAAHTAHPNVCARTGRLVGWHWSQLADAKSMEITFTEWDSDGFREVAATTHRLEGCELAPHDMCLTDNCIMIKVNALTMNTATFLAGVKGPAASLAMDGRAPVTVHVFPRPTAVEQFEPYAVEVPACFSIHFSHGYEDPATGNLVSFFSGWPPSDSKDFLGAWGGFAPDFTQISPTFIWRLEIDPDRKECVDLGIAPGAANACAEHPLVHPKFASSPAKYSYAVGSNLIGDSSAPCGYVKLCVEEGSKTKLPSGCFNSGVDAYWFGTRHFAGEPLIVPKKGGDLCNEREAYLLGMVQDSARHKSFVAIFDLERDLREGPVCKLWLRSQVPHGLHGCFTDDSGATSVFC